MFLLVYLDTCLLLYIIVETLLYYLHEINQIHFFSIIHLSAFACYFSYLMNRLCAALCSWLITCFTFIRFINIFRQFDTVRSNLILLTTLFIIIFIANSYSFFVLEYTSEQNSLLNYSNLTDTYIDTRSFCNIRREYANNRAILLLNTLVAGVFNLAMPSLLILIVNIIMICLIKRIYSLQERDPMQKRSDTSNYRSTRSTLLVISVTYTLVYLPYLIFYFLMIILEDKREILYICSEVAYILRHVSHSINFYAYAFTNLRFRRELLFILSYLFRPCLKLCKREKYRQQKRTQLILLDKCRLPPPPTPIYSNLLNRTSLQFHRQIPI